MQISARNLDKVNQIEKQTYLKGALEGCCASYRRMVYVYVHLENNPPDYHLTTFFILKGERGLFSVVIGLLPIIILKKSIST